MDPQEFTSRASGRLFMAPGGYWAFCPHPLPPDLMATWDLAAQLSRADRALAELAGTARNLPNPHLLIRPFVRREAVLSSRIEGTQASFSDLLVFEAAASYGDSHRGDVHEVANYVRALEHGLARLSKLPLSLRLIREMHAHLLEGVRGQHLTPGEFRRSQNWIGPTGCTLMDATYVPPPIPEMHEALNALELYIHAPSELPPLIRLALIHYQFEAIHPFLDGNGRIGRLLISLLTITEKLLHQPLLYLSAYFEQNSGGYYKGLLGVSRNGEWNRWIGYFLDGVAEQANDARLRSQRLLDLWQDYRSRVTSARSSTLLLRLIDDLFERPVYTIVRAKEVLGVTHRAATLNVMKLVDAGILTERERRGITRLFVAEGIMEAVDGPLYDHRRPRVHGYSIPPEITLAEEHGMGGF